MKLKTFRDKAWPAFLIIELLIILLLSLIIFFAVFVSFIAMEDPSQDKTALIVFELLWGVGGTVLCLFLFNSSRILDRAFGHLLVYDDKVVFKCLFRITRTLAVEDVNYVGVEDYAALNRGLPIVRGDEVSFIYFSVTPYPQNYKNKISLLKNKSGFIKFSYTDELAILLLKVFSNKQVTLLKSFYEKMRAQDRILKMKKKK